MAGGPLLCPGGGRRRGAPGESGTRTVNSLPCPCPALAASTVPPCSSTRRRASVSPTPRPACERSSVRSTCTNISKIRGIASAGSPMPLSLHAHHDLVVHLPGSEHDAPARLGVLGGVVEQVREHLREARRIAVDRQRVVWAGRTSSACLRESMNGRAVSIESRSAERKVDDGLADGELAVVMRETSMRSSTSAPSARPGAASSRAREPTCPGRCRRGAGSRARCGSGPAGCAARARASRGTRPCAGRPRAAPRRAARSRPAWR
jgi:hypothetical protein